MFPRYLQLVSGDIRKEFLRDVQACLSTEIFKIHLAGFLVIAARGLRVVLPGGKMIPKVGEAPARKVREKAKIVPRSESNHHRFSECTLMGSREKRCQQSLNRGGGKMDDLDEKYSVMRNCRGDLTARIF